jgi:transcription antitermination factor NusG
MLFDDGRTIGTKGQPDQGWHALYTRHHHEKSVARTLAAKGFAVFLPLYAAPRKWKDRTKIITLPLFSCYVFIQDGVRRYLDIVTTPGVHWLVCSAGTPAIISPREIASIRRAVERCVKIEPHPFIRRGDRVRVKAGPLEGVEGILVRKTDFSRLVLTVDLLGQAAAVEVDVSMVERVPSPHKIRWPASCGERRQDDANA